MKYALRPIYFLSLLALTVPSPSAAATLYSDNFDRPDGLITNEYAFWSPTDAQSVISPDWQMDSGSFFIQGNAGWSGVPDDCSNGGSPNAESTNCTNSAIFRLNSKRFDFDNFRVAFSLNSSGLTTTPSTPAVAWDGIHIFLRYQSEFQLYYASINRREQTSVIKKKCPGGSDNGGTYYELTPYVPHVWSPGSWQHISATIQTNPNNTVTIALYDDNGLVVQGTDNNVGKCAPITNPGAIGIRGDNNNFKLEDLIVTDLSNSNPAPILSGLSPTTATAGSSAFTLTVNGSNFANSSVVQWNGQALPTAFVSAARLAAVVPVENVAAVGNATVTVFNGSPGGGLSAGQTFTITTPATNPVPALSSLSPAVVAVGGASFTLTVNGSTFAGGAVVQWNGQNRPTVFVSASKLQAAISASDIATRGTASIKVVNPAPGGGASGTLSCSVNKGAAPFAVVRSLSLGSVVPVNATIEADVQNAVTVEWKWTPRIPGLQILGRRPMGVSAANASNVFSTTQPVLALEPLGLQTGEYSLEVTAQNADGVLSEPIAADVTLVAPDLAGVRVFPNPWRIDQHSSTPQVIFDHLAAESTIRIFTLSGRQVKTLSANASAASWDLTNDSVNRVGSGLYIYSITNTAGQQARGKLAIIR